MSTRLATAIDLRSRAVYAQSGLVKHLQSERKRQKITYAVLAAQVGIAESSVCDILSGAIKEPSWVALTALADGLGVRLELMDGNGEKLLPPKNAVKP